MPSARTRRPGRPGRRGRSLATACELRVVAEGIETAEQLDALLGAGVTIGQGHLFGRAQPLSTYQPA